MGNSRSMERHENGPAAGVRRDYSSPLHPVRNYQVFRRGEAHRNTQAEPQIGFPFTVTFVNFRPSTLLRMFEVFDTPENLQSRASRPLM